MISVLIPESKRAGFEPWGLLLEGPAKFSNLESRGIISNLKELFYLHTLSMTRSSSFFRSMHRSVFRYRFTKNGFTGFEKRAPGTLCCVLEKGTLLSQCLSPPRSINGYWWIVGETEKNCLGVTCDGLHCSIPSRGSRNTRSRFMPQKPGSELRQIWAHLAPRLHFYLSQTM